MEVNENGVTGTTSAGATGAATGAAGASETPRRLGGSLRYWRERKGISLEDLADRLTIAPDCLQEVEEGKRKMARAAWDEAAIYLQVPVEALKTPPQVCDPGSGMGDHRRNGGTAEEPGPDGSPENVRLQVGVTIRNLREKKGWGVTELAHHSGLSPAHVSEIERGRSSPSVRTLEKLAQALGVSSGSLVKAVGADGIGIKLKLLRERLGLSQKQLAEKAGVSYGLIGQIESGRTQSSVTTLSRLARALGVSPCYFLMEEEEVLELARSLSSDVSELLSSPQVRELLGKVSHLGRREFELVLGVVEAVVSHLLPVVPAEAEPWWAELRGATMGLGPQERGFLLESARFLASRKAGE